MDYHSQNITSVVENLSSHPDHGLSSEQVTRLQETHGKNKLQEKKKKTTLERLINQFKDVMILSGLEMTAEAGKQ